MVDSHHSSSPFLVFVNNWVSFPSRQVSIEIQNSCDSDACAYCFLSIVRRRLICEGFLLSFIPWTQRRRREIIGKHAVSAWNAINPWNLSFRLNSNLRIPENYHALRVAFLHFKNEHAMTKMSPPTFSAFFIILLSHIVAGGDHEKLLYDRLQHGKIIGAAGYVLKFL